jgi:hypothetical protein
MVGVGMSAGRAVILPKTFSDLATFDLLSPSFPVQACGPLCANRPKTGQNRHSRLKERAVFLAFSLDSSAEIQHEWADRNLTGLAAAASGSEKRPNLVGAWLTLPARRPRRNDRVAAMAFPIANDGPTAGRPIDRAECPHLARVTARVSGFGGGRRGV